MSEGQKQAATKAFKETRLAANPQWSRAGPFDDAWLLLKKEKDPRLARAGVDGYNKPKRTPNHPKKSHIVVARSGDELRQFGLASKVPVLLVNQRLENLTG